MTKRIYSKTVFLTDLNSDNITLEDDATPFSIIIIGTTAVIYFWLVE